MAIQFELAECNGKLARGSRFYWSWCPTPALSPCRANIKAPACCLVTLHKLGERLFRKHSNGGHHGLLMQPRKAEQLSKPLFAAEVCCIQIGTIIEICQRASVCSRSCQRRFDLVATVYNGHAPSRCCIIHEQICLQGVCTHAHRLEPMLAEWSSEILSLSLMTNDYCHMLMLAI